MEGSPELSRVIMVGDSLHHDTKGAKGAGIDSVLVTGQLDFLFFFSVAQIVTNATY